MLRFGTDGVRGVALSEVTPEYVTALGIAAARVLGAGTWLIGRDTRQSGPLLEAALAAGLRSAGATVTSAGVVPTPALAWMSAVQGLPAAMITASHNPYTDNGVKIFAVGGVKLSDAVERAIEAELERQLLAPELVQFGAAGTDADNAAGDVGAYVEHLVTLFPTNVLHGTRVVIDCANGAMSAAAPAVLRALGADVTVIHATPDGTNINANCGATYPGTLAACVIEIGADAGLAFDGDGDRVIAVDNAGAVVDGDRLIALGALQLQAEGALTGDTVVVTVMSNLGFHRAMAAAGIGVVATAVGDRYVLEALAEGGYAIGGEQSGHVIYPRLATTGDGLLAGARLLHHLAESGQSLSSVAGAVMATFPQVLVNVRVRERHPDIAAELAAEVAAIEAQLGDDGRVLLRPSGTEPLIRVMVEAATDDDATRHAAALAGIVRARFSH